MSRSSLNKILNSYKSYYDVKTDDIEEPFIAEAVFHSHDEQFFLIRRAQLSETENHEYVFFVEVDNLKIKELEKLIDIAWKRGLSRVKPSSHHRNSDIVLVVLAQKVDDNCLQFIKKLKLTKNYKFSLHGWSSFQLIVKDFSNGKLYLNKSARNNKKLYEQIF